MRMGSSRWWVGILAAVAAIAFWLWLSYHRGVGYTAWQMTALVQAFAAYAAMEGGELPGSLEDLRKSPLVIIDGNALRVKCDHIPALRTTQTYPDMIRIDFRDLRVRWLHQSFAQTGPIVESRRFEKALMPLAEQLTRALDEFRELVLLPEEGKAGQGVLRTRRGRWGSVTRHRVSRASTGVQVSCNIRHRTGCG